MVFKEHPPDTMQKGLRLGCGTVFGILIGLYATRRHWTNAGPELLLPIAGIALSCGLLAMIFGDRFWHFFSRRH